MENYIFCCHYIGFFWGSKMFGFSCIYLACLMSDGSFLRVNAININENLVVVFHIC